MAIKSDRGDWGRNRHLESEAAEESLGKRLPKEALQIELNYKIFYASAKIKSFLLRLKLFLLSTKRPTGQRDSICPLTNLSSLANVCG